MIRMIVTKNNFAKIAAELAPKVTKAVVATALQVESQAKETVPVLTGNLRRSLSVQPLDPFHVLVGTDVEYAPYVEYGTHRMAAQPYLTPAVELARPVFTARLSAVFRG